MKRKSILERYRGYLPVTKKTPRLTLGEGNTPLVRARKLEALLDAGMRVYLKCEFVNPTGSFKDRGMVLAVAKALEEDAKALICASTGNTSSSAAAYGATAGLPTIVILPEGGVAQGKLAQCGMYGAIIVPVRTTFSQCQELAKQLAKHLPVTIVNSLNPYRLQGQKTAAFEIVDELRKAPDYHSIPVGNGGNITAYWMGYIEYFQHGKTFILPRMLGWQAEGAAPLVLGKPIENPKTVASAIRIGKPEKWHEALAAVRESYGLIRTVTDEEILEAQLFLASREGIFCEPASAASVAGLIKICRKWHTHSCLKKEFLEGKVTVCTLTGHGLKDPDTAFSQIRIPESIEPTVEAIKQFLGW